MGGDLGVRDLTVIDERLASAGQPTPDQFGDIAASGYELVIDLTTPDSPGALPDEGNIVRAVGMQHVYIPVSWEAPTMDSLRRFIDAMDAHRQERVFVHCTANLRASAFVYLYRHLILRIAEREARLTMHSVWDPNPTWVAFLKTAMEDADTLVQDSGGNKGLPAGTIPL